jgi:hypothetical protein
LRISFEAESFSWRGPSPFVFVALPAAASENIRKMAGELSYGWGCVPVSARIGETSFATSLMPKDGMYLLPLKLLVQKAEGIGIGDRVRVRLEIG